MAVGEMPKETLYLSDGRHLVVQWGRDTEQVRIGIDFGIPFTFEGEVGVQTVTSLSVDLSQRMDVNRLITVLRRARDAAYGRDA